MMPEARVAPSTAPAEASRIARELYCLNAAAHPLPGEYDDNFHLLTSDSRAFVLKIMHPAREESFVDMQCRALTHLAERAPHLALPRVVPSREGHHFARIKLEDGTTRLVWLLTFLPGTTLAEAKPHSPELLASLGSLLGEIDSALIDFSHPATSRELKWDLSRSLWARDYLPQIQNPKRRALAGQFLDLFEAEAVPNFPHLRHSVIFLISATALFTATRTITTRWYPPPGRNLAAFSASSISATCTQATRLASPRLPLPTRLSINRIRFPRPVPFLPLTTKCFL